MHGGRKQAASPTPLPAYNYINPREVDHIAKLGSQAANPHKRRRYISSQTVLRYNQTMPTPKCSEITHGESSYPIRRVTCAPHKLAKEQACHSIANAYLDYFP